MSCDGKKFKVKINILNEFSVTLKLFVGWLAKKLLTISVFSIFFGLRISWRKADSKII